MAVPIGPRDEHKGDEADIDTVSSDLERMGFSRELVDLVVDDHRSSRRRLIMDELVASLTELQVLNQRFTLRHSHNVMTSIS
jgi:hypothetical protein